MKVSRLFVLVLFIASFAVNATAQEHGDMMNMSDEQKSKKKQLKLDWAKQEIKLSGAIKIAKLDLKNAMHSSDASSKDVTKFAKKLAEAKGDLIMAHAAHHNKVRALFTAEQWDRMHEKGGCSAGKRGEGMEHGMEKGHEMKGTKEIEIIKKMKKE